METERVWVKEKKKKTQNFLLGLFQGVSVPWTICSADAQVAVPAHVRQGGYWQGGDMYGESDTLSCYCCQKHLVEPDPNTLGLVFVDRQRMTPYHQFMFFLF